VIKVVTEHVTAAKSRLLEIGATLGPLLAAEDNAAACQQLVDHAILDALGEISENTLNEEAFCGSVSVIN